jgi:FkbM family methyltransferase
VLEQIFIVDEYAIRSAAHAQAVEAYYRQLLAEGKTPIIVDCGANIGLASVWYHARYPGAHILAVEPEPENFLLLEKNLSHYPGMTAVPAAVSDRETRVNLSNPGEGSWAWRTAENTNGSTETVTLPDLLGRVPNGAPFIVKIDIEGGEVNLFRSNTEWVERIPVIVFEHHDPGFPWRGTAHAVLSILTKLPRDYVQFGEYIWAFSHTLLQQPGRSSV